MHPTVRDRLEMRERARALGDIGLERACNADLARYGMMETTALAMPERAVPGRKRGRPPKARCEHGRIVGRCNDCDDPALD